TVDGRRLERVVDDNWGSAANPMTPDQVRTKFRENAVLAVTEKRVEEIVDAAGKFETAGDAGDIVGSCVA
ncbi:MAG: MmgE/PrpD family protein, partial [Alphaproteobacteria bacterium]|nr:MmgE/PrpD family protein [Alphaproteobacteria bacterium]